MPPDETSVSDLRKLIARHVASYFGGKPHVSRHSDGQGRSQIDILRCEDRPKKAITSYSTIGLCEYSIVEGSKPKLPYEISIVSNHNGLRDVLAEAAFAIIKAQWFYGKTRVMRNIVRDVLKSTSLIHLFFTDPFWWDPQFSAPTILGTKRVRWFLAVPIFETEREYGEREGYGTLDQLLQDNKEIITDFNRMPLV